MQPLDPTTSPERLTAFADGELDAAGQLAVLREVATDADALAAVEDEQRLNLACRRVVRRDTPPVGDELRRRIEAMAGAAPAAASRPVFAWLAAAAAVALLLVGGGVIGRMTARPQSDLAQAGGGSVVPASLARSLTFTHVECSRLPAGLHGASVAEIRPGLVTPLELDLHRDEPFPDLSSIGYRFVGAGPCGHPLDDAVHLLYRSADPAVVDTLSVFVRPFHADDAAERQMQDGRLYQVVARDDPHPLVAWRTERLIYFLVGDGADTVDRARAAVASAISL